MHAETLKKLLSGGLALPLAQARWKLSGPDRVRYLNGQVTNDVKSLRPGHALYAAACTAKGKMQGDLTVAATPDTLWIDAPQDNGEALGLRLEHYLIADDALLEEVTPLWDQYHLAGEAPPPLPEGGMSFASERFGLPGWDLWVPAGALFSIPVVSPEERETFRILRGLPKWGQEMDETTLPQEMRFDQNKPLAISYSKGCYTGQETIARIKSIGHVNRQLCRVACDKAYEGPVPQACSVDGKLSGTLTSFCQNPEALDPQTIGLAVLRREATQPGTLFEASGALWRVIS